MNIYEMPDKFRDYLSYIVDHKNNVLKEWEEMQEKMQYGCFVEKFNGWRGIKR